MSKNLFWTGTLEEYLKLIYDGYIVPKTPHLRVYEALVKYLHDPQVQKEIIGMDKIINQMIDEYFLPASRGYDMAKRILILIGPPGSGKSSFVRFLKRALEKYSQTNQGAVFRIKGCPLNEDPLLALPEDERQKIFKHTGVTIDGYLSPLNQYKLKHKFNDDWKKIEVERFVIDESKRQGIGTFFPSDPYTQEIADLIGSVDYSKVTTYGSPSDPRAYRYDGEFQKANQGLLELHEMFKSEERMLYPFLTLAEEKMYKISRQAFVHTNQFVIGHSNEEELKQFIQTNNQALLNRMCIIRFPYNLKLKNEVKVYESKLKNEDKKLFDYFSIETLAAVSILSRLKRTKSNLTLLEKMDIYNNEENNHYTELIQEHIDEGMVGLDPRIALQVLSILASRKHKSKIDGITLLTEFRRLIKNDLRLNEIDKEHYEYATSLAERYYYNAWKKIIKEALIVLLNPTLDVNTKKYYSEIGKQTNFVKQINQQVGIDETNEEHYYRAINDLIKDDKRKITFFDLPDTLKNAIFHFTIEESIKQLKNEQKLKKWVETDLVDELEKTGVQLEENHTKIILLVIKNLIK
ncbi:hypothetical protein ACLIA0_04380 [Bacillaceae bacterium W0354]